MPARLLVLGIDAASPQLIERFASAGELPAIAALLERSAVARTAGIDGFFVGATWPSFATGVGPGRHGLHYLAQIPPGRVAYEAVAAWPERVGPFWSTLSRAGRRVAVLDVPLSRIAAELNGVQTVEWGGHDSLYGFRASPPSLAADIASRFGPHPQTGTCDAVRTTARDYEQFVRRLADGATVKGELTRALLAREEWDLFVQVFTEAHCAGHQCWHLHDSAHPAHDPEIADTLGDPLLRVLRAIDAAIAGILADAGDATILLAVPHGMSHFYGAQLLLPEILFRLGVAVPTPDAARRRAWWWQAARRGERALPGPVRGLLRPLRQTRPSGGGGMPTHAADPKRSLCFPVANGLAVGGIRLGAASPAQLADDLTADLLAIVDPSTGLPLVRRVLRSTDLWDGPAIDLLPDLLVEWADNGPTPNSLVRTAAGAIVRAKSPKIGTIAAVNDWGRTGDHRPAGLIAAAGAGIAPGPLPEQSLLDVAPTILALLGVEAPSLEGRPIPGLGV
jgi:predicted AlkP superfamily phosphohydrolase/phosphomutase